MREAGYILRTFAHYVRDGLIPNMFPDGEQRGPLPHRRRDAVVLPRDRPLRASAPATTTTLRTLLPMLRRHRRSTTCEGTRFGIGVDPADGLLAPGRRGLPADVDGREGRRLGRHAAARQGGRDQRALVQRALPAGRLDRASTAATRRLRRCAGHAAARARVVQRALLERRRAATCTTSSTASRATIRRAGRTRSSRSRSTIPVLDRTRWEPVMDVVRRAAADAGRAALAGARRIRTTRRGTTATCARATPPITRARCGRWLIGPYVDAWLKLHPDDRAGRARACSTASSAHLERGVRRHRSARSSTPRRRTRRAAASRRRGASPRCCASW